VNYRQSICSCTSSQSNAANLAPRAEPAPPKKEVAARTTTRSARGSRLNEKLRASQTSLGAGSSGADVLAAGEGSHGGLATVVQLLAKARRCQIVHGDGINTCV
jgi:hypothetical protein